MPSGATTPPRTIRMRSSSCSEAPPTRSVRTPSSKRSSRLGRLGVRARSRRRRDVDRAHVVGRRRPRRCAVAGAACVRVSVSVTRCLGGAGGLSSPIGQEVETGASTLSASLLDPRPNSGDTSRARATRRAGTRRGDGVGDGLDRPGRCPSRWRPGGVGDRGARSRGRRGRPGHRGRRGAPPRSVTGRRGVEVGERRACQRADRRRRERQAVEVVLGQEGRPGWGSGPRFGLRSAGMLLMRSTSACCSLPL